MRSRLGVCLSWLSFAVLIADAAADTSAAEAHLYGLALDRFLVGQARVMRLADPIRVAGVPYCGKQVAPVIGVFAADDRTFRDLILREPEYKKPFSAAAIAHAPRRGK